MDSEATVIAAGGRIRSGFDAFPDYTIVSTGRERAYVYAAGGISFDLRDWSGWTVTFSPGREIQALALAVRRVAYPKLPDMTLDELVAI